MVIRCGVPGCGHYRSPTFENYSFYTLPKDPCRRKRWIEILKIEEENISENLRVCGRHFQPEYAKCRRLSENVFPLPVTSDSTNAIEACSSNTSTRTIILDDSPEKDETANRRKYPPFIQSSQHLSQASYKSIESNKDSSISCESPISETLMEKFFSGQDLNRPKKNYIARNNERNFIVSEGQLRLLLRHCSACGARCSEAFANNYGVDTEFVVDCKQCEELVTWSTQPELPSCGLKKGNLDTVAGVILSGNTYETLKSIAANLRLQIFNEKTFYNYANNYIYPAVDEAFLYDQHLLLDTIKQRQVEEGDSLSLGVDCRFSRPGYTATYGVTSAMCLDSEKIVATVVKSKADTDVASSSAMEVSGTRTVLKAIMQPYTEEDDSMTVGRSDSPDAEPGPSTSAVDVESDSPDFNLPAPEAIVPHLPLNVSLLVTDENQAVMAMVRREFPELEHQADPWHLRKAIIKLILRVAKRKANAALAPWIPSIRKWLWTAMKECGGNSDKLVELWRSLRYHIIGQHSWEADASYTIYRRCAHGDLSHRNIAFLPQDSDAYLALVNIIDDQKLQNRLRRCTSFKQTSCLESFHSLLCRYVPKHLSFIGRVFESRVHMAVLDWNENIDRPYKTDQEGNAMMSFEHPAAVCDWRAKKKRVVRSRNWSSKITENLAHFAAIRWKSGHVIGYTTTVTTHRPLVSMYKPLDRVAVRANLHE